MSDSRVNFKIGDKVVRLSTGCVDFDARMEAYGIRVGQVYTIKKFKLNLQLEELGDDWWNIDHFKLYEEETMKQFTKRDLVAGNHVVEFRNGTRVMLVQVLDKIVGFNLQQGSHYRGLHYQWFDNLAEDLTYPGNDDCDVMKVYQVKEVDPYYQCYDYNLKLIWTRPTKTPEQIEYENLMTKIDELKAQAEKLKPNN